MAAFPRLRDELYEQVNRRVRVYHTKTLKMRCVQPSQSKKWRDDFNERFGDFESRLYEELVDKPTLVLSSSEEVQLTPELFERLKRVTLVDRYDAYQALYDEWQKIAVDLEILQAEGFDSLSRADPFMVMKRQRGERTWRFRTVGLAAFYV